jgi:hypothetical protein
MLIDPTAGEPKTFSRVGLMPIQNYASHFACLLSQYCELRLEKKKSNFEQLL